MLDSTFPSPFSSFFFSFHPLSKIGKNTPSPSTVIFFVETGVVWNKRRDLYREIARESKQIIAIPGSSSELIVSKIKCKQLTWNLAAAPRKATVLALFQSLI